MRRFGVPALVAAAASLSAVRSFSPAPRSSTVRQGHGARRRFPARDVVPGGAAATAAANARPSSSSSSATALPALLDPMVTSSLLQSASSSESLLSSTDAIQTAFNVATFFPQPFWLFLILLPNAGVTRKLFGGMELVTLFCLVHFFIVVTSILQPDGTAPMAEFNDVFDPAGNPQAAMVNMMRYPNFVSEEWSHVLTWDLFVGRWIWLDGLRRGVFTSHSVLLCNLIGPPGLLLHWATCAVTGKGLTPNEAPEAEESENDA